MGTQFCVRVGSISELLGCLQGSADFQEMVIKLLVLITRNSLASQSSNWWNHPAGWKWRRKNECRQLLGHRPYATEMYFTWLYLCNMKINPIHLKCIVQNTACTCAHNRNWNHLCWIMAPRELSDMMFMAFLVGTFKKKKKRLLKGPLSFFMYTLDGSKHMYTCQMALEPQNWLPLKYQRKMQVAALTK